MSGVQHITVPDDAADQRIDRWLRRMYPVLTQGRVEKMCRKGDIRLDGGRVKASSRVVSGQIVRVPPMPEGQAPLRDKPSTVPAADVEMIQSCVIYRDDHIIALNKPPGLAVQGGSKTTRHVDGMTDALRFGLADRPKLVHRLDRDTSGVLVLARTGKAAAGLSRSFQSRVTRKIYWAAIAGKPRLRRGTIKFGLVKGSGHGPNGAGEKMSCIHPNDVDSTPGAKHATTDYAIVDDLGGRASWAVLVPITGRTHQLRAHMAEIGHPIVGDGKYGTNNQENMGDGWGAQLGGSISRKLHLHARSISFNHPVSGEWMTITANMADHMSDSWDFFGWSAADVSEDPFEDDV